MFCTLVDVIQACEWPPKEGGSALSLRQPVAAPTYASQLEGGIFIAALAQSG